MSKQPHSVEYIEWIDSAGWDGWHSPSDANTNALITSVGWITKETDTAITLTSHINTDSGDHHADMEIVKCSIVSRGVVSPKGSKIKNK